MLHRNIIYVAMQQEIPILLAPGGIPIASNAEPGPKIRKPRFSPAAGTPLNAMESSND